MINKSSIESFSLLTKEGKEVSILLGGEADGVIEHVAAYDESLKTFIVENPLIGATTDYDEAEMLDMFDGATIVYGEVLYNGDAFFSDEIWIREISLWNDERYVSIERAIPRNFWNHAFAPFKAQQRLERRDFDACYRKAMEEYQRHDLEADPCQNDSDDMLRVAEKIAHDVWDVYDKWKAQEREEAHV